MHADSLIKARWVIPMDPPDARLEHHAVAVSDGRIAAIIPSAEAQYSISASEVIELNEHALIPGLINCHTHAAMNLLRGLADDLPLMDWLHHHIWPAEQRWVDSDFVRDGTRLALAEMLRGGITCFNDMYLFPDTTAREAMAVGIRAMIGLILIDLPTVWAKTPEDYLGKALATHDNYRGQSLIRTAFAPHAPYSVSDQMFHRVISLSEEMDIPIHTHLHETREEIQNSMEKYGMRPLQRLQKLGAVSERLIAVHATQLEAKEITLLAQAGSHIVHCPESNLKLASGICPVPELLNAGVNVGLGTDGAASNNNLDLFGEMRTAALLAKAHGNDPAVLPACDTLALATIRAAQTLGLDEYIGSLKTGKQADMAAVNLGCLETQPVYDPVSQLVYAAEKSQVSDVWVDGNALLRNRSLVSLDTVAITRTARAWGEKIAKARGIG